MALVAEPVHLREANAFIAQHHRHHRPVRFHLFSIGVSRHGALCGVATVMRPVNQNMGFGGYVAEVSRLATDGTRNACSFLLARCARTAFEMGYLGILTYTLASEDGASLRAAGFRLDGLVRGKAWTTAKRVRNDCHPIVDKCRWIKVEPRFENHCLSE